MMNENVKGLCKFEEFKRILENKILKNVYVEGEKLPSIRKLAEEYDLNKATVNMAVNSLVSDGLLRIERGKGTFVSAPSEKKVKSVPSKTKIKTIGILVPSVMTQFYPGIVRGAEDVCRENGFNVMLGNSDTDHVKEKEYMASFVNGGVSGLIVAPSMSSHLNPYYNTLKKKKVPVVFTDGFVEGFDADLVKTDNIKAGYDAAASLAEFSPEKIVCFTGPVSILGTRERVFGFNSALDDFGIDASKNVVNEVLKYSEDAGYKAAKEVILKHSPDAVFCSSEALTPGVLRAAKEAESKRPLNIACFSDRRRFPGFDSNLTLVIQKGLEIGKIAAELLIDRISGKNSNSPLKKILLEAEAIKPN